jgi:rhodanese-related sulfurtransferase
MISKCAVLLAFSAFVINFSWDVSGDTTDNPDAYPELKNLVVSGQYCGVHSLYVCLDVFGKKVDIRSLLAPQYISSNRGSTAEDITNAAREYGIHSQCYGNMTWHQLLTIREPMILHFRGSGDSSFNHWVACLGVEDKCFRIVDVPHEMEYLTSAELLARWDGIAVVLSSNPITGKYVWQSWIGYFVLTFCIFCSVFIYKNVIMSNNSKITASANYRVYFQRFLMQASLMLVVSVLIALFVHSVGEIGFLRNPSAVADVTRRYYAVDVPEVTFDEMERITEQKSALVYDARYYKDFEQGSVPCAISFPINSNLTERRQILHGVDKAQRIVVYCQSSGCGYSDSIASFLKFNGYINVSIYRGGYRDWESNNK